MVTRFIFVLTFTTPIMMVFAQSSNLQTVAGWTYLNFGDENYIPENAITTGVTVTRDRIVLAIPRFKEGVPSTIAFIPRSQKTLINPVVFPFPNSQFQNGYKDGCIGLVSVFRTRLDACGRLWTVDSGWYNNTQICPPKLLVFNVQTGDLIKSAVYPKSVLTSQSLLTFLVLDYDGVTGCDPAFVYVTDAIGFGLVVYDVAQESVWRFEHESFRQDSRFATINVAGEETTTEDGIIAITMARLGSERALFYQALAGIDIYAVPTTALRNPILSQGRLPVVRLVRKPSPGIGLASDCPLKGTCHVFVSPATDTAVDSWSPDYGIVQRLAYDPRRLQYVSDMSVSENHLWVVSNRFQSFDNGTYDSNGINIRLLRIPLL